LLSLKKGEFIINFIIEKKKGEFIINFIIEKKKGKRKGKEM
jgi:hypothetical protein